MKSTMKALMLCVLSCFMTVAWAQDLPSVEDNYERYLDDGRLWDVKSTVKMSITSLGSGFADFFYEQKLDKSWSASVSAGVAFLDINGWERTTWPYPTESKFKNGYSFGVESRYYVANKAILRGRYYALRFRNRTINGEHNFVYSGSGDGGIESFDNYTTTFNTIYLSRGRKAMMGNRMSFEMSTGLGASFTKLDYKNKAQENQTGVQLVYNIEMKIGFNFK